MMGLVGKRGLTALDTLHLGIRLHQAILSIRSGVGGLQKVFGFSGGMENPVHII